jgi:hypothetical protein
VVHHFSTVRRTEHRRDPRGRYPVAKLSLTVRLVTGGAQRRQLGESESTLLLRVSARGAAITIPDQFWSFYVRVEQGVPGRCWRPQELNPRDADWVANPLLPFFNICCVGVSLQPQSLEPRPKLLQFAGFTKATHEGLTIEGRSRLARFELILCPGAKDPRLA